MPLPVVTLKAGREKSVRHRHPWIFSGAVETEPADLPAGDLVDVHDAAGEFLGRGAYNPHSQIRVRLFTLRDEPIDAAWFAARLRNADQLRRAMLPPETDAYRVLHAEGDGAPGLIIDRYADGLVVTLATAGVDRQREAITAAAVEALAPAWILEHSTGGYRREEGLTDQIGPLYGPVPDEPVPMRENGLHFLVDIRHGQKTGFFLDQRAHREAVRRNAAGRTVLNAFGYTGGFAVYALAGGAKHAVTVEINADALRLARANHEANGQTPDRYALVQHDVFQFLRDDQTPFDLIILDPPAFAKNKASLDRAARGYKDINLQAFKRLPRDGLLWTFSCSGHVSAALQRKILFGAALDAGREVQILETLGHHFDHPINVYHPEGEYLTGFLCRVSD